MSPDSISKTPQGAKRAAKTVRPILSKVVVGRSLSLQAREVLAFGHQFFEQWCRLPDIATVLGFELLDVGQDVV